MTRKRVTCIYTQNNLYVIDVCLCKHLCRNSPLLWWVYCFGNFPRVYGLCMWSFDGISWCSMICWMQFLFNTKWAIFLTLSGLYRKAQFEALMKLLFFSCFFWYGKDHSSVSRDSSSSLVNVCPNSQLNRYVLKGCFHSLKRRCQIIRRVFLLTWFTNTTGEGGTFVPWCVIIGTYMPIVRHMCSMPQPFRYPLSWEKKKNETWLESGWHQSLPSY